MADDSSPLVAKNNQPAPVQRWELPQPRAPRDDDEDPGGPEFDARDGE